MIRIGIGISTKNRLNNLKVLIDSIKKYTTSIAYDLFVADDHSTDNTIDYLVKNEIEFTSGKELGPNLNKNRLFKKFINYSYIFILEDDIEIVKEGWVEKFILASTLSNLPFLQYYPENAFEAKTIGQDIKIAYSYELNTECLFYTRRVLEKVGGIDSIFKTYGYGCQEMYKRIIDSKLLPEFCLKNVPFVQDMNQYIKSQENKIKLIDEYNKIELFNKSQRLKSTNGTFKFI